MTAMRSPAARKTGRSGVPKKTPIRRAIAMESDSAGRSALARGYQVAYSSALALIPPHRCGFPRVSPPNGATTLKMRAAAIAALMILEGCSQGGGSAGGDQGKFAGLDGEILKWRTDIMASDPLCKSTVADQKCESFEVACKAERELTADDKAKGVSARVVAAITWNGFDSKFQHAQSGSRTAEFDKSASGWTRAEHPPVNMSSCADL